VENDKAARQSKKIGVTKKLGCPAHIYLREIIAFPEYKVSHVNSSCDVFSLPSTVLFYMVL